MRNSLPVRGYRNNLHLEPVCRVLNCWHIAKCTFKSRQQNKYLLANNQDPSSMQMKTTATINYDFFTSHFSCAPEQVCRLGFFVGWANLCTRSLILAGRKYSFLYLLFSASISKVIKKHEPTSAWKLMCKVHSKVGRESSSKLLHAKLIL